MAHQETEGFSKHEHAIKHELVQWRYSVPVIWGREALLTVNLPEDNRSVDEISLRPVLRERRLPDTPYHVFSRRQKRALIYIVSLAGLLPPLTSNMYFPAHSAISVDMNVSAMAVQLTVTIYMIAQGIAPLIWVPISDSKGRRLVFIAAFLVFIVANVGLALTDNYGVLMVFRALQGVGSGAMVFIGAGVIDDITTPEERNSMIGIFGGARMFGQFLAPLLGGVFTHFLGFHSLFTALETLACFTLIIIIFFLPETLRSIAGDGTVPLAGVYKPFFYYLTSQPDVCPQSKSRRLTGSVRTAAMLTPLKVLLEKDVLIMVVFGSIVFTIWAMVTTSAAILFQTTFDLTDLSIGLAFLPNGAGCFVGSYCAGVLLDRDYRKIEEKYREELKAATTDKADGLNADSGFPTERARLRSIWPILAIFIIATGMYGFSFSFDLDAVLMLQFLIAFTASSIATTNSALLTEICPGRGTSASLTSVANLLKCAIGAIGVAIIDPMIRMLTPRFAFLILASVSLVLLPLLIWAELRCGPRWRTIRLKQIFVNEAA